MGDPAAPPFPAGYTADAAARRAALEPLILSASGWRKIFAADGNGESSSPEISPADRELAAAMARCFADFLREKKAAPLIAVGIDSRETGPALAEIMLRVFIAAGIEARYLFISPAPEIMAWAASVPAIDGFAYVSASHNPRGYNGVKFGLGGGVIGGEDAKRLIAAFRELVTDGRRMEKLVDSLVKADAEVPRRLEAVFRESGRWKKEAEAACEALSRRVITGEDSTGGQEEVLVPLRREILRRGCGIVADLNGSARALGIDRAFLEEFGVRLRIINGRPREIGHAILPEGEALETCRLGLEAARAGNPAFVFGYTPDNDGDRGNIVFWDESARRARILEAQDVFALACASELAFLSWRRGGRLEKTAVAVNDPTSLRIDRIAAMFGAKVFRAEVGEANVVSLARKLRAEGWTARILGEGSNGGNITWPQEVRDPLATVFALLKLLYLPELRSRLPGLARAEPPSLRDVLDSLPAFLTLASFREEALLTIKTRDHGELKRRYEKIFLREWEARKPGLARRGFVSWEELNHEGITERRGMGAACRTGPQTGGLSILLKDKAGETRAFLWLRGSGTEPVFRVSVDLEGRDEETFAWLLAWQRGMVLEADSQSGE